MQRWQGGEHSVALDTSTTRDGAHGTRGTYVLALLHCDAHDTGHGLHAEALHGLAALLLATGLLGASLLVRQGYTAPTPSL